MRRGELALRGSDRHAHPHRDALAGAAFRLSIGHKRLRVSHSRFWEKPAKNLFGNGFLSSAGKSPHFESETATNAPKPISVSPVAVRCLRRKLAEDLKRAPMGAAMKVTIRSQDVLSATEMVPNRRNCQNTPPLVRFTN